MRGTGRAVFVATLLLIAGTLNIIYGIGALGDANIFKNDQRYVLTNLNTLGWVLVLLGIIQLTGGISLIAGNTYGRVIAIVGGTLGAIGALLSIGGAYPGGRWRSSSCASTSSTASSSSARRSGRLSVSLSCAGDGRESKEAPRPRPLTGSARPRRCPRGRPRSPG